MYLILLVEDNDLVRELMTERLLMRGFQILAATNGEKALALTRAERPDLILMDLSIPLIDGWEATRQIKADPELQAIPVIALTAHAVTGEREKALEAGCDEYETKPVDFQRLMEKIQRFLPEA